MNIDDRVFRTYDGWKKRGRHVRKGEKAVAYIGETALFGKDQTAKGVGGTHATQTGPNSYYYSGSCVDHNGYY